MDKTYEQLLEENRQLATDNKRLKNEYDKLGKMYDELSLSYEDALLLYDRAKEQLRIENELRIARDIQMAMVPGVFPKREGLDMYAEMTPAREVGGDFYGYVMQGDKLYFCVGDVSGKSVPASLFMTQATRLFRTLATQNIMPAEICTFMNDSLTDGNTTRIFTTFFLGLVDLQTGHLDFCNCGHNAPIIGDAEGHFNLLKMIPNIPIGAIPKFQFHGEQIDCIKGKTIFLYTDGLSEAENKKHELFDNKRIMDILKASCLKNAQQVIETLTSEVEKYRNGAEPNDDLTMMYLKIL